MGIWRIPVDEIDRPGSFASHMNRSIVLLLEVLFQLKDHDTLVKVSFMLQRTPDQGKKYLRDVDRQVLAKRAFFLTVKVLEDNLSSLTGVPSMGEMTTTDASKRPGSDESKHAPPKKLTEGDAVAVPREASQAQLSTTPCVEKGIKVQEVYLGRMETSTEVHKGSDEPMDLDPAHWRRPSADPSGNQTEAETSASVGELQLKAAASSSRTPELSLEELSISSRQQQLIQAAAGVPKVAVATGGTDQGMLRRPNRKRKLLEDVESGKTLLLDAYRVWQQGQKVMTYDLARIEKIMSETYMLIKQVDEDVALDQAVKFCQIQLATSAQRQSSSDTPTTPKYAKDHIFFPAALSTPVLLSHATCHPLSNPEGPAKVVYPEPPSKLSRPQTSGLHEQTQHRRAAGHPTAGHPAAGHHTAGHPTSGHHTAGHPTAGHPTTGHPTAGHPTAGHPTAGHPTVGHPTAGHHTAGHHTAGHHTAGHTTVGHPTAGHPTAGHTTAGHPTAGHPMAVGHPPAAALAFLTHTEERGEPSEGLAYRQQESNLCQQMKLATVSTETASGWFQEETATCSSAQPGPGPRPGPGPDQQLPDPSRIRSRVPPNMPKLFIPSTVTKFPPEITVTPPTPTLLSPKGSISEETKQRLKNVILSSQSAATVKKDTLSQPALEVQETSSQESSLESESEDEEDDYMDV